MYCFDCGDIMGADEAVWVSIRYSGRSLTMAHTCHAEPVCEECATTTYADQLGLPEHIDGISEDEC